MLIESTVFNFQEVGEKSFEHIKNECLVHFASRLQEAITSDDKSIRMFWLDSSVANYKNFHDFFGSKIKYNSKNIVFEETLYNGIAKPWSVQQACMDVYGLEYIEKSENQSGYYKYRKDNMYMTSNTCCCESTNGKVEDHEEKLRFFYKAFGIGEFPYITITVIRLGNKDHYFYTIHR